MTKIINGYEIEPKADLSGANLSGANLTRADLTRADLTRAVLSGADLTRANLFRANLFRANLFKANLSGANLSGADLRWANLSGAIGIDPLIAAQTLIVPEGDFIGYKKLRDGVICKLRIPEAAKRSSATSRKCRAEFAIVLEGEGWSTYDMNFHYKVGETVRPTEPFDLDRWNDCASGIHFFLTRIEAEKY